MIIGEPFLVKMTLCTAPRSSPSRFPSTAMRILYWLLPFCILFSARVQTLEEKRTLKPKWTEKCGIYLAKSTIPGAGLGMFAGHHWIDEGDIVTDSDLVIPVFELDWHNAEQILGHQFLWTEYSWAAHMFEGMDQEVESGPEHIFACSPGMGAAVNCRLNLVNVEDVEDTCTVGRSGVPSESPGAGAFTPYYGRQFQAVAAIEPGMELYLSYGEAYFSTRADYKTVPLSKTYSMADTFLNRFRTLEGHVPALQPAKNTNLSEALYDFIRKDFPKFRSRLFYALPSNYSEIDYVLANGGTSNATYQESIRSLEWLEEHGSCMDNIKDGVSTIPDAGRGAFANRFIPKGGTVAPIPLIHIGNRDIMTMYDALPVRDDGYIPRNPEKPTHQQLMLNYCFGHADTHLLLCPYGLLTALINHSHQDPNAKIQWSSEDLLRHPEWLNETYYHWYKTKHAGLSFDVVALRDIQEDEEILIDYGMEWEEAWQQHVASFDRPRRDYMPAFEMNQQADLQIKTIFEADYEGTGGIYSFCRKHWVDLALGEEHALQDNENVNIETEDENDEGCYPCRVVHRNHNNSYIAELFSRRDTDHPSGMWEVDIDTVEYVLFDVPRDTFFFHDAFYGRDHHQEWAFRHDMRIPDDMLPDAWRHANQSRNASFADEEKEEAVEIPDRTFIKKPFAKPPSTSTTFENTQRSTKNVAPEHEL